MAEYIDREEYCEKHCRCNNEYCDMESCPIWAAPATDVAPVQHGRWVTHSDRPDSLICSVCNCGFDMWKHDPHNYCPNCGAKMDGGAGNGC